MKSYVDAVCCSARYTREQNRRKAVTLTSHRTSCALGCISGAHRVDSIFASSGIFLLPSLYIYFYFYCSSLYVFSFSLFIPYFISVECIYCVIQHSSSRRNTTTEAAAVAHQLVMEMRPCDAFLAEGIASSFDVTDSAIDSPPFPCVTHAYTAELPSSLFPRTCFYQIFFIAVDDTGSPCGRTRIHKFI